MTVKAGLFWFHHLDVTFGVDQVQKYSNLQMKTSRYFIRPEKPIYSFTFSDLKYQTQLIEHGGDRQIYFLGGSKSKMERKNSVVTVVR